MAFYVERTLTNADIIAGFAKLRILSKLLDLRFHDTLGILALHTSAMCCILNGFSKKISIQFQPLMDLEREPGPKQARACANFVLKID